MSAAAACVAWELAVLMHLHWRQVYRRSRALDAQEQVHAGDVWPEGAAAEHLGGPLSCSAAIGVVHDMRMQLQCTVLRQQRPAHLHAGQCASSMLLP